MANTTILIAGTLKTKDGQPLANLRIEAWDKDKLVSDFVGQSISDKEGRFSIPFTQQRFKELFLDIRPDIYFKIYKEAVLIHSTEKTVIWNIRDDKKDLEIIIDMKPDTFADTKPGATDPTDPALNKTDGEPGEITITGIVKHANGNAVANIKVILSEQMLRGKKQLADTSTDNNGIYTIAISKIPDNTAYIAEALDEKRSVLAASPVIYNPKQTTTADLVVTDNRFKGDAIFKHQQPALKKYYNQLTETKDKQPLSIDDVHFVATQAGTEPKDTFHWLRANEMETATNIPAEAFYAMFKQGFPTNLTGLSAASDADVTAALKKAADASLVSDEIAAKSGQIAEQWNAYVVEKALNEVPYQMDTSLSGLLSVAIPEKQMQKKVMTAYLSHEGTMDTFWEELPKITGDDNSSRNMQTALKLSVLTGNQPDMITALMNKQNQENNVFYELAAMDTEDWETMINDISKERKKSVVPSFITAGSEEERVTLYAGQMVKITEQNFPTHAFFGKLAKQKDDSHAFAKSQTDLLQFFSNNPSFDIKKTSTISLATDKTDFNFDNIENKNLLINELQSVQRLSVYTTDFRTMSIMKNDAMDSAYNIVSRTENDFVSTYTPMIGSVQNAQTMYKLAEKSYMKSAMLWSAAHPNLSFQTATTPSPISEPDLRTMFGTLDACECEHCTSVFSPAAYYTDILNFLYSRTPSVYNELVRRRPDLVHIELTCENTNTPLPYVDLVNELLENFILTHQSPAAVPAPPASYQTTWQANELAANPEHIRYEAYDELKKAVYPRVLPFNFPIEEARLYLKHLGIVRHQLMTTFFAGTEAAAFSDFAISMERLVISKQEAAILSGETTGDGSANSGLWNFYGFDKTTGYKPLPDPADSSRQIAGGNWNDKLTGRVDVFLQQTDIMYKELLSLLLCHTINPVTGQDAGGNDIRAINIVSINGDNASCRLDNLKLTGATDAHLQTIHRFLRLWRKSGWNIYDLDKACLAFGLRFENDIPANKNGLTAVSQTCYFLNTLRLPVESVLALWSNIGSDNYIDYGKDNYPSLVSLYEKLFSNKTVTNPVDPAFAHANALAGLSDDHSATIMAALQIGDEDYRLLNGELADTNLTLSNLSILYRTAMLAQKSKLSIKDFLALKKLIGASADAFASPASTFLFLLKAGTVKTSGFSIAQLHYLLQHDYLEETAVAPSDDEISVFLSDIRSALRGIESSPAEEQRNTVVQKFSEKLKISATASGLLLQTYVKGITDATRPVVEDFRADDFSASHFLKTYTDRSDAVNPKDYEPVFVRVNPAADAALDAEPDLFNDYMRLDKIATIINKLKLSDTDLATILENSAAMHCTDLASLPVTATAGNFTAFETLMNLVKARDAMPVGTPDFFDIVRRAVSFPNKTRWLNDVITRTNWDRTTLEALVGNSAAVANGGMLNTAFPASFVNGDLILQVKKCLAAITRTGLNKGLLTEAIKEDFDSTTSVAIKNAAKAKYDESQWLTLAKPLRNELREKQREALVAFAVAHPDYNPAASKYERWKDSSELYEYMLIDVEMKPISLTSRIKQAICSVQLFVDRVLLNLEHANSNPAISPLKLEGSQVEEWNGWRKIYRVWEANRKIFLYPENWIEPELRDDKSPFFKELETQLKQNELIDDNVEDAFHNYLDKLDEVARLEVVGLYHQIEKNIPGEDDIDILHVFARTSVNPHKYFHRTLENGEWTAWQKLEIDVDGDHIVPAVFNRKLCLFWLFFTQDGNDSDDITEPTPKFWKIQAAWSEFRKNKWTAKRLSKEVLESKRYFTRSELETYKKELNLRHWIDDPGEELAEAGYDGNLHLYLNPPDHFYIDGVYAGCASFVFENTNTDPDLIEEYQFYSFIRPEVTDDYEQMIKSRAAGNPLTIQYEKDITLPNGNVAGTIGKFNLLNDSPNGRYKLVIPTDEIQPYDKHFFFQDKTNTFFVTHKAVWVTYLDKPDYTFLDWNDGFVKNWGKYYTIPDVHPGDPVINPGDPVFDPSPIDTYFGNSFVTNTPVFQKERSARTVELKGVTVNFHPVEKTGMPAVEVKTQPMMLRARTSRTSSSALSSAEMIDKFENLNSKDLMLVSSGQRLITKHKQEDRFSFSAFYHRHVKTFKKELCKLGIRGMLKREVETQDDAIYFDNTYLPTSMVVKPYPLSDVDFTWGSAYSQYNWELFFHVPMLVACRLKNDQRFEEARQWFHYIFDPTRSEGGDKERFWQFKPFYDEAGATIETLDALLRNETELNKQVEKWMKDPFKPHVIARMRISAYMKNVVMKYLDNLIEWADNLFRRDTIEAINEATNLYIMAANILGERPQSIPPRAAHDEFDFDDIKDNLDAFSNAMVNIETLLAPSAPSSPGTASGSSNALGKMFYFCVPRNEFLMTYWDTVADRLFKIRNSMNIQGIVRTLPLFEPPIDPAMLVRAAAADMDLNSILADINASLPNYRFLFMLQKAVEFSNEVKSLGAALLQALEKHDAEAFALLRSAHEQQLLNAILTLKEKGVDDAKQQADSIKKAREITQLKHDYYSSREFMNNFEKQQLDSVQTGLLFSVIQGELNTIGGVLAAIPNLKAGAPTSMGITWGGDNLGAMMNAISTYMGIFAAINNAQGSMAGTLGSYTRRMDDWQFQSRSSVKELEQLDKQILSSEIKLAIAEKDLQNQQQQIDNSKEADEFMRSKFTNQQLYDWMIGQLSTVYFQSYQLAYDLAKKAEQCYQYELGEWGNTSYIQFGYWDSLKKGLLSAEKLQYDLRRMESSYYDLNRRGLELTKHISLVMLNPQSIVDLRKDGTTTFIIPEAIYDIDFPGHYFRRIKSVSVSLPCIAGPYTTINASLRLLKHTTRLNTSGAAYESADYSAEPDRFRHVTTETHSIATSSAQNDSGVFELNFRDERYLPFEGCGVFGEWQLELSMEAELRMFDYNTISDVIISIRYTAKDDAAFTTTVTDYLKDLIEHTIMPTGTTSGMTLQRLFSLRHEYAAEWHKLFHPSGAVYIMNFSIAKNQFPYFAQSREVVFSNLKVYGLFTTEDDYTVAVTSNSGAVVSFALTLANNYQLANAGALPAGFGSGAFTLTIKKAGVDAPEAEVKDVLLAVGYNLSAV